MLDNKKLILQIDGGGIRGVAPAIVLAAIEQSLRDKRKNAKLKLCESLDLCCGTSTGAIMAAMVCVGIVADRIKEFYETVGVALFTKAKTPFYEIVPKYNRDEFIQSFKEILKESEVNPEITLGELPKTVLFMATAYNLCSYRTHFIKSWEKEDLKWRLHDVVTWSGLSAAYYFGKVLAPDYKWTFTNCETPPVEAEKSGAVFQDGGQGTENCTLGYALTEILARGWDKDGEVVIISLGTGNRTDYQEYDEAKKTSEVKQTIRYLENEARPEAMPEQVLAAQYVQGLNRKVHVFRLDFETDKDYALDDVEHINVYKDGALRILRSKVFGDLIDGL